MAPTPHNAGGEPLRILHLVAYSLYSGPIPSTVGLALAQRRLGHTVHLAYDRKRGAFNDYEEAAEPRLADLDLGPPEPLTLSTKSSLVEALRDRANLRRIVDHYDVVHCHMSHDHTLATLARARNHARVVRTIHAARSLTPRFGQRWLLSRAHGYIVRCRPHRETLVGLLGAVPVETILGGIDIEEFTPHGKGERQRARERLGVPQEARLIMHAALIADRGQAELVGALARLNSHRVHVLFVGRGEGEEALRLVCKAAGLEGKAHFAGYLQGKDLLQAYAAADVAFVGRSGNDASVRSVLEAMASGLPVLGVQQGAVAEVVDDVVGYPVEACKPVAIMEALKVWKNDTDAHGRGLRGRQRMESQRTFDAEAAATEGFYRRLLTGP